MMLWGRVSAQKTPECDYCTCKDSSLDMALNSLVCTNVNLTFNFARHSMPVGDLIARLST